MTSVKNIARRFLSLSLSVLMVFLLIPATAVTVSAAEISGLSDTGIILTTDGDAVCNASGNSITCTVTGDGACNRSKTGSLTIKNGKAAEAVLKFDYEVTLNGGLASVDGAAISSDISGSYEKALAADDSITVSIQSPANGNTSTVTLTNISMLADVDANVTFLPAENGSYTVDGTAVTEAITLTKNSSETFALVATPAEGYKFLGWKNQTGGAYVSYSADVMIGFDSDVTIAPVFVDENSPVFSVDGAYFTDLNEAGDYAVANSKSLITLVDDGTLSAGNYTIPAGTVLLIPFDDNNTMYLNEISVYHEVHKAQSPYRTLTLASGVNLNVASGGAISIGSRICAHGTNTSSWNGTPTGPYGLIKTEEGSKITVNDGGFLFAYGYISGNGSVDVLSGGNVYELFQIRNWRGGSATTDAGFTDNGVFPMSQYYVQNIEVPLTIEPGAKEYAVAAINAQNMAVSATASFIGDDGMFVQSGTITKRYDSETDRLIFDVEGDLSISPLSMEAGGMNINTEYFALPINNNITINVVSGATTLSQDVALLPGSVINIGANADVNIAAGSKVYVYDKDEWGKYGAAGAEIVPVGYSTANGAAVVRNAADLTDAKMNVNGTITVNGELYTTAGGADITSSEGTGKISYHNAAGTQTETYQCLQSNTTVTPVAIPITPAQLHNGNTETPFTETDDTVAEDYYTYSTRKDMWVKGDDVYYTITFKNWDGEVLSTVFVDPDEIPVYDGEIPAKAEDENYTYAFSAWSPSIAPATEDTTYTADFTPMHKDGWFNDNGTLYYFVDNVAVTGIARVEYPDASYGYAEDTEGVDDAGFPNDGKGTFIFDDNGALQQDINGFYTVEGVKINADYPTDFIADGDTVYVKNGEILWHPGEVAIGEDIYYFAAGNTQIKGTDYSVYRVDTLTRGKKYTFDADGKLCKYNGLVDINGETYYYENYAKTYAGLILLDGDYYYINSACKAVKGRSYYVSKTNGLLPASSYDFDADGRMIARKNGIVKEADGWFYYENNKRVYKGLFKIGDDYYYAKTNCKVVHGQDYYISKTNGLLPRGKYTFDEEGKLMMNDGIVKEGDTWTYYVRGVKTYAGLFKIGDDIYYAKSDCTVVHGQDYYVSKTNDILPQGNYTFDEDGKLQLLNGIVKNGDDWTYYKNGAKVYAGLIEIDGDYYYVNSAFKVIHDRSYFVSKTNGVVKNGDYTFDENGVMQL